VQVKNEVADRNKTFKLADVGQLMSDVIDRVTVEDWQECVRHAERLQDDDFVKECSRDSITEHTVINLRDSDTLIMKKNLSETETYVFDILHG
jgi:hypothetical protein